MKKLKLIMENHKIKSPRKTVTGIIISLAVILAGILLCPGEKVTAPDSGYKFTCMVKQNLFTTEKTQAENTSEAFEKIRPSVVQIHVGSTYGGGSILKIDSNRILIVSNRHVLENFAAQAQQDVNSNYVTFFDGEAARVQLVGLSDHYDAGLVSVPVSELCSLRSVRQDSQAYENTASGTTIFSVHSQDIIRKGPDDDNFSLNGKESGIADQSYIGVISQKDAYIEDLGQNMMYCMCYAEAGMSGSGMFDGHGNLIGMVTGGTAQNEMVSISLPDLQKAITEIEEKKS
jgi:hypothetical protein